MKNIVSSKKDFFPPPLCEVHWTWRTDIYGLRPNKFIASTGSKFQKANKYRQRSHLQKLPLHSHNRRLTSFPEIEFCLDFYVGKGIFSDIGNLQLADRFQSPNCNTTSWSSSACLLFSPAHFYQLVSASLRRCCCSHCPHYSLFAPANKNY